MRWKGRGYRVEPPTSQYLAPLLFGSFSSTFPGNGNLAHPPPHHASHIGVSAVGLRIQNGCNLFPVFDRDKTYKRRVVFRRRPVCGPEFALGFSRPYTVFVFLSNRPSLPSVCPRLCCDRVAKVYVNVSRVYSRSSTAVFLDTRTSFEPRARESPKDARQRERETENERERTP